MENSKPKYFGTDGIRGQVGEHPLVPEFVLQLGLATGHVMKGAHSNPTFVVGRDTRQSGEMLQNALVSGLLSAGVTIIDVGVIPTPGVAYLVRKLEAEAGVVISASHNPVGMNGIKIINRDGSKLDVETELAIERIALDEEAQKEVFSDVYGRVIDGSGMREMYIDGLIQEHAGMDLSELTIVLDCANGAASWYGPECLARFGARVITINASPTGRNINNQCGSEQIRQQPSDLHKLIQQYSANLGIAFDGDADRAVFVDEEGLLIDGDHVLAILAEYLNKEDRLFANAVVTTTMRNQGLRDFTEKNGFNFIETPVGDKYITEELVKLSKKTEIGNTIGLGGEQAGHIILFDREHNSGDGLRTALYLLRVLVESGSLSLAALAGRVEKTPQVIASAKVPAKPALDTLETLEKVKQEIEGEMKIMRMSLRYSGTEPLFRAMLEAGYEHSEQELANAAHKICTTVQLAAGATEPEPDSIEILNVSEGGLLHSQSKP
jgi:phosphoglucosamine mutase